MIIEPNSPLQHSHLAEFTASAIAHDIAALNFRSFDGDDENDLDEVFTLLITEPKHNNNGTLSGKSQNDLANALRSGGWIFEGHGICVKPNSPRVVDGKTIKYESPRGTGSQQLFIPRVSWGIGWKIAGKAGAVVEAEYLKRMNATANIGVEDCDFWDWFLDTTLPIVITEGAKKACSLVSAGYPAIALNGIWGWGINDKDEYGNVERDDRGKSLKTIHPDLETFLDGRELVFALDRDDKPATKRMVEAAKAAFVRAIAADDLNVTDLTWRSAKGVDDYIAAKGVKALDRLYANRKPIKIKSTTSKGETVGFRTDRDRGLMLLTEVDGEERSKYIGNHLEGIAYLDNQTKDNAALLLEFKTLRGEIHRFTMHRADLAGDSTNLIAQLLARGYAFSRKQKSILLDYLSAMGGDIDRTYTIVDTSGWVGKSFVSPHKTHGDENIKFRDVEQNPDIITSSKGTLNGWITEVAAKCAGNSRLILALGASFAAPLMPLAGIESGGFHLVGDSSKGKTIALAVAASVTGVKEIPHWRTTTNGLESIATAFNNLCLPLDEIKQADAKEVGDIAYMLGNGQGKARMRKDLTNRASKRWQLMVLSSGEVSIANYMREAGIKQKGGQEVRMPDIPAVPDGSIHGCFETIHSARNGAEFATQLGASTKRHQGTALDRFLSHLVPDSDRQEFIDTLIEQTHLIAAKLAAGTLTSEIGRIAKRFALVQVALGLAHNYGLLPFPIEQIDWAISTVFTDWLNARGGDGAIEIKCAVENVKHLLTTNEFSDRVYTLPNNNDRFVRNLLAYRTVGIQGITEDLLMPPSVFDRECCQGVSKNELVKELQRLGILVSNSSEGKATHKRRVNGKRQNFYVFQLAENQGVTGVTGVTDSPNTPISTGLAVTPPVTPKKNQGVTGVTPQMDIDLLSPPSPLDRDLDLIGGDSHNLDISTFQRGVTPVTPVTPKGVTVTHNTELFNSDAYQQSVTYPAQDYESGDPGWDKLPEPQPPVFDRKLAEVTIVFSKKAIASAWREYLLSYCGVQAFRVQKVPVAGGKTEWHLRVTNVKPEKTHKLKWIDTTQSPPRSLSWWSKDD